MNDSKMMRGGVKKKGLYLLALAALLWLAASLASEAGGQRDSADGRLKVFVSILPQAYFVERVGGQRVVVEVLVQPGQSPHTFEPTPKQMARLASADLFFRVGVKFENQLLPRIESAMKGLNIVDTRRGIELRELEAHDNDEDPHNPEQEGGLDPHIWLSPILVKEQARTIRDSLIRLDPGGRKDYEASFSEFAEELDDLHQRLTAALAPLKGKKLLVFHPCFGYFADAYGLEQLPVETCGAEPSARQLARLIEEAMEQRVRVIFVQPQFSQKSAELIAEAVGGAVVALDPLARDFIRNMEEMARLVEQALR